MSEREILFRGKRSNGEWIEGSLLKVNFSGEIYNLIFGDKFIGLGDSKMESLSHAAVIPETVGQFTGLTDKNGTRIFEGDILIYEDDEYYDPDEIIIVTWYAVGFALKFQYRNGKSCYDPEWASYVKYLKVIGNIHDNPSRTSENAPNLGENNSSE